MGLSFIGAGFGRTGTESMRIALGMIGYGPCHHMHEVLLSETRVDNWRGIAKGTAPNWAATFDGFESTVDWPSAFYWRQLAAHYPDAKILLTLRDPESWYANMEKTILPVLNDSSDPDSLGISLIKQQVFDGKIDDKDHIIATYNQNTSDVQAAFGSDRLLTYYIGDGWQPLCSFLECEVPQEPYPHTNKPEEFQKTMKASEERSR